MKNLGRNLRQARKRHSFTQKYVAAQSGITREAYRNIETGKAYPRTSTLTAILDVLGLTVADAMREYKTDFDEIASRLKPCPFCGERLTSHYDHHGGWIAHKDEITSCILSGFYLYDEEDCQKWNRRKRK